MQGANTLHVTKIMKNASLFAALICAALSACSSPGAKRGLATHVDRELVLPEAATRYDMKEKQVFFFPVPIESPMPVYPAALASSQNADVVVCVEITIAETGAVSKVELISLDKKCVSSEDQAGRTLMPLISAAVLRWTYFSAGVCTYQLNETECNSADARIDPVAVKLAYGFIFRKEGVAFEQIRARRS